MTGGRGEFQNIVASTGFHSMPQIWPSPASEHRKTKITRLSTPQRVLVSTTTTNLHREWPDAQQTKNVCVVEPRRDFPLVLRKSRSSIIDRCRITTEISFGINILACDGHTRWKLSARVKGREPDPPKSRERFRKWTRLWNWNLPSPFASRVVTQHAILGRRNLNLAIKTSPPPRPQKSTRHLFCP